MSLSPLAEMTVENADVDLRSSKKLADKFSARFAHPEFSRTSVGMRSSLGLRSSQRRVSSDNKQAQWKKNAVERMRRHESGARARVGSGGDPAVQEAEVAHRLPTAWRRVPVSLQKQKNHYCV